MKTNQVMRDNGEMSENGAAGVGPSPPLKIEKVACAKVQDSEEWYDIFSFCRLDCQACHIAIRREDTITPNKLACALRAAGATGCDDYKFSETAKKMVFAKPKEIGSIVIRGGWYATPGSCFVLPDVVLGHVQSKSNGNQSPPFACLNFDQKKRWQLVVKNGSPAESNLNISCRGSSKGWKKHVAQQARNSSAMMLGIAAAFAAPLLKIVGVTPFTVVLTGPSTGGKTCITLAAASVIGMGRESDIPNWFMTPAGLEQRAEIHSDMILPIDDLANASGSDVEIFRLITEVPYRITAGAKKHTLTTAKTGITGRPPLKEGVSTIILTSYENSLEDIAGAARRQLKDGVRVRFLEVPIAPPASGGVFDLMALNGSPAERVSEAKALAESLSAACAKNHGYVFRKWIRRIIKDPAAAKEFISGMSQKYMASVSIDRTRPIELRHSERFAFLFGAAAYAIDRKLLPWTIDELEAAVRKCHQASLKTIPRQVDNLQEGKTRLKEHLRDRSRIVKSSAVKVSWKIDGWFAEDHGVRSYFVFGTSWRTFFASDEQRKAVEKYLVAKQILIPAPDGTMSKQRKLPNSHVKGPRGYELRYPIKEKRSAKARPKLAPPHS